jgi:hypothetical protein
MVEKEFEIEGKKFIVRPVKYKDIVGTNLKEEDLIRKIMIMSTSMSEAEYDDLTLKQGIELQKVVNELNGLIDFQKPLIKE